MVRLATVRLPVGPGKLLLEGSWSRVGESMQDKINYSPELKAYLQQWGSLQRQLEPIRRVIEAVQQPIQPVIEMQKSLRESIGPILDGQENWLKTAVPLNTLPDLSSIATQVIEVQKAVQKFVNPVFFELHAAFQDFPEHIQKALLLLGRNGWYLDEGMSFPALWKLEKALSDGKIDEAEIALVEYFENRLAEVEESITTKFPRRAHLIQAAMGAHRREEYALSIPVLLAQADGICKEAAGQYLFMKRNRKPCTAIYVDQIVADAFMEALLSPLSETLPIGASEKEREQDSDALNRHTVIHGESLDYGSKINSLKAISLVNYVAYILHAAKADELENQPQ